MANEITITTRFAVTNGYFEVPPHGSQQSVTQNRPGGGLPGFFIVGTAEEDVDLSDLTVPGWAYIKNAGYAGTGTGGTSPTITFGPKSAGSLVPFCDLKVGEEHTFRLTAETPTFRIKASQEEVGVVLRIVED